MPETHSQPALRVREMNRVLREVGRELWRAQPAQVLVLGAGTLTDGLLPLAAIIARTYLITSLFRSLGQERPSSEIVLDISLKLVGLLLISTCRAALGEALGFWQRNLATAGEIQLRLKIVEKTAALEIHETRAQLAPEAALAAASRHLNGIIRNTITLASAIVTAGTGFFMMFLWHGWLPLAILAPVAALFHHVHRIPNRARSNQNIDSLKREAGTLRSALTNRSTIRQIRVLDITESIVSRLRTTWLELSRIEADDEKIRTHRKARAKVLLSLLQPLLWGGAAIETLFKLLSFHNFILYGQSGTLLQSSLKETLVTSSELEAKVSGIAPIFDYLGLSSARSAPARPNGPVPPIPGSFEIEFRNVSFVHPDAVRPVLEDISFSFRSGERITIYGASGSGKSTLANLLCGFHECTSGVILLNGEDIRGIPAYQLHSQIALMLPEGKFPRRGVDAGRPQSKKPGSAEISPSNGFTTKSNDASSDIARKLISIAARARLATAPLAIFDNWTLQQRNLDTLIAHHQESVRAGASLSLITVEQELFNSVPATASTYLLHSGRLVCQKKMASTHLTRENA